MVRRAPLAAGALAAAVAGAAWLAAQDDSCKFTKEHWKNCVNHEWDRVQLFPEKMLKTWHKGFAHADWKDEEKCGDANTFGNLAFRTAKRSHSILEGSDDHPKGGRQFIFARGFPGSAGTTRTGRTTAITATPSTSS